MTYVQICNEITDSSFVLYLEGPRGITYVDGALIITFPTVGDVNVFFHLYFDVVIRI